MKREETSDRYSRNGNKALIASLSYLGVRTILHNYGFGEEIEPIKEYFNLGNNEDPFSFIRMFDGAAQSSAHAGIFLKTLQLGNNLFRVRPARKSFSSKDPIKKPF